MKTESKVRLENLKEGQQFMFNFGGNWSEFIKISTLAGKKRAMYKDCDGRLHFTTVNKKVFI